jgi:uncharacterized heparinase superfamily protein
MTSAVDRARLYWETVRHLRPVQIYGRVLFRLARPTPDLRPAPPLRPRAGAWAAPARRRPSQTGPETFRFLNETRALADHGWDDAALAKLWRYNLHYFDDLNAEGAAARGAWHEALVDRWVAENPPGAGTGWEPYPTSLRIVNWIKWVRAGATLGPGALHSLAVQARWLTRRLEHHLLGNHLFANAKALVFAGAFFQGPEADGWLELGRRLLAREIPEQILPDGGQFELSPLYHALALEDVLDLVNILRGAGLEVPDPWLRQVAPMRRWLAVMSHPDGEISFFNDAAIGVAPTPAELEAYAARLGFPPLDAIRPGCVHLADSGYVRLQDDRAVALIDVARVGPDYLPGHAHADTLSFELSTDGRRMIVNSGTSVYGEGPERLRQRGTAAHNTVVVDGADSSEVWSGFRVARRARPRDLTIQEQDGGWTVAGAHDGYRRLAGRPWHRRRWRFGPGRLEIADRVEGGYARAEAAFHFPPDLSASIAGDGRSGALAADGVDVLRWRLDRGAARLEPSTWRPEFGLGLPSHRLVVALDAGESAIAFTWTDD